MKNITNINEASLPSYIQKIIFGSFGNKIVYIFRTPATNIKVAWVFEIINNTDVILKFGKLDGSNIYTPGINNLKLYKNEYKFINIARQTCIDDFLNVHTQYRYFLM